MANRDESDIDNNSQENWSDVMKYDEVADKLSGLSYAVWRRARDDGVTIELKGDFDHFQHDITQFTDTSRLTLLSTQLTSLPHNVIRQFTQIKRLKIGQPDDWDENMTEMGRFMEEMKQLEVLKVFLKRAICDIPQGICAHLNLLRKLVIS
jgi:hypothetical protein